MPATIIPRRTFDVFPMPSSQLLIPVLIQPIAGLTAHITSPIIIIPPRGYISIGLIPSILFGSFLVIFSRRTTTYPATKPARSAARNPPEIPTVLPCARSTKLVPFIASTPPAKPTASPGLSAIDDAINAASIGNINAKAALPVVLKNAATGVFIPKLDGSIE